MTDENFLKALRIRQEYLRKELEEIEVLIGTVAISMENKPLCKDTRRHPSYIIKEIMTEFNPVSKLWTRTELRKTFNEYVEHNGIRSHQPDVFDVFVASLQYLVRSKKIITEGNMGTMMYHWNPEK